MEIERARSVEEALEIIENIEDNSVKNEIVFYLTKNIIDQVKAGKDNDKLHFYVEVLTESSIGTQSLTNYKKDLNRMEDSLDEILRRLEEITEETEQGESLDEEYLSLIRSYFFKFHETRLIDDNLLYLISSQGLNLHKKLQYFVQMSKDLLDKDEPDEIQHMSEHDQANEFVRHIKFFLKKNIPIPVID